MGPVDTLHMCPDFLVVTRCLTGTTSVTNVSGFMVPEHPVPLHLAPVSSQCGELMRLSILQEQVWDKAAGLVVERGRPRKELGTGT